MEEIRQTKMAYTKVMKKDGPRGRRRRRLAREPGRRYTSSWDRQVARKDQDQTG